MRNTEHGRKLRPRLDPRPTYVNLTAFLYTLASVPMFASRPFMAAFVTALLARFGASIPWISDSHVIQALHRAPAWFTSATALLLLGLLALGEVLAAKRAEVRAVMEEIDSFVKAAVAMLVALALIDSESAETIHAIQKSGLGLHSVWATVVGGAVFAVSTVRRGLLAHLSDVDDDDDIGLQSLLSWAENSWTILGLLFLVIFPIVALVLSALTALGLFIARRRADRREELSKVPCAQCRTPIFPHATRCCACRRAVDAPRAVGVFGQPKERVATDLAQQRFDLVARKRCPDCATRLKERAIRQACRVCQTVTFANQADLERYLAALAQRLPRTLLICLGLSSIPVLGVIPGVVYYRLTIVSGLRGYIPPLSGCMTRVVVKIINWGIIALQPIPILGALVVPLMCLSTYWIYRRALVGRAQTDLAVAVSLPRSV